MWRALRLEHPSKDQSNTVRRALVSPLAVGGFIVLALYILGFSLLGHFFYLLGHSDEPDGGVSSWSGWSGVEYMFAFGDSYTTISFDIHGTQPNSTNPLGNNANGWPWGTQILSPNYVEYLTTRYNQSLILTYDFGWAGATIDNEIDQSPFGSQAYRNQVEDEFLPNWGKKQHPWTAKNTLFTVFFGINDIALFHAKSNASEYPPALMRSYEDFTQKLYDAGARNFLFINVPAVNRTPGADKQPAAQQQELASINQLNRALQQFTLTFGNEHHESTVFFLDANALTNKVMDNPKTFAISSIIKNTTDACDPYAHVRDPNLFDFTCGIPRNEYFWADQLHPTSTVHDLIADQIVSVVLRKTL